MIESGTTYYQDKFKLLAFVPVNDCKYATDVPPELQAEYDFTGGYDQSPLLYFKPLPYVFQITRNERYQKFQLYLR